MTLNSEIIQDAFRETNMVGMGNVATTEEQTEALALLQRLVNTVMASVVGVKYRPWFVPTPFHTAPKRRQYPANSAHFEETSNFDIAYPPINSRVVLRNTQAQTIYMPAEPIDGATMSFVDVGFGADVTIDGNGMFFGTEGRDTTDVFATRTEGRGPTRQYLFREDTASWNLLSDLTLTGEMPFPELFDEYWITVLAIRLQPRFGAKNLEVTLGRAKDMTLLLRGWYRPVMEALSADIGRAQQSYSYPLGLGNPDGG